MVQRFPWTSTLCQASSSSWLEASSSWLVSEYRRFTYQTARKELSKLLVQPGRENGSIINRAQSPVLLIKFPECRLISARFCSPYGHSEQTRLEHAIAQYQRDPPPRRFAGSCDIGREPFEIAARQQAS